MTGTSLEERRKEYDSLIEKKKEIEDEIKEFEDVLKSHNIGMKEPLIDSEGFPRADIDVYAVRTARSKIIHLQNDHKGIMNQIEKAMHAVFEASASAGRASLPIGGMAGPSPVSHTPLAVVNSVAPGSPAAVAGLIATDKVVSFGGVAAPAGLKEVAELVGRSENIPITLEVLRGSNTVTITLTPQKWSGRGLLGCHLVPPS